MDSNRKCSTTSRKMAANAGGPTREPHQLVRVREAQQALQWAAGELVDAVQAVIEDLGCREASCDFTSRQGALNVAANDLCLIAEGLRREAGVRLVYEEVAAMN